MNPIVQFSGQYIDIREMRNISEVKMEGTEHVAFSIFFKNIKAPFTLSFVVNDGTDVAEFMERVETIRATLANTWAQYNNPSPDAPEVTWITKEEAGRDAMEFERLVREDDEAIATLMGSNDD